MNQKDEQAQGSGLSAGLGQKSAEIMAALARMCAEGKSLTIAPDWGYGSGTLIDPASGAHTHFGLDIGEDEAQQLVYFIDGLHSQLCGGVGLSWA